MDQDEPMDIDDDGADEGLAFLHGLSDSYEPEDRQMQMDPSLLYNAVGAAVGAAGLHAPPAPGPPPPAPVNPLQEEWPSWPSPAYMELERGLDTKQARSTRHETAKQRRIFAKEIFLEVVQSRRALRTASDCPDDRIRSIRARVVGFNSTLNDVAKAKDVLTLQAHRDAQAQLSALINDLGGHWHENTYDTGHWHEWNIPAQNPVVQVVFLIVVLGKVFGNMGVRLCTLILQLCRPLLEAHCDAVGGNRILNQAILDQIPLTLEPVLRQFNLDAPHTTVAQCPQCGVVHPPTSPPGLSPHTYPLHCDSVDTPGDAPCGTALTGELGAPLRPVLIWSLEDYIARLMSRSDLEGYIDQFADDVAQAVAQEKSGTPRPDIWSSMKDANFVRKFKGPDDSTLFVERPGTGARILLAGSYDGFNLQGMRIRGERASWGLFSWKCPSLPIHLQNLSEYMHPYCLVKGIGGREISTLAVNSIFRIAVGTLKRGWQPGLKLSRTARYPEGREAVLALAHLDCDAMARPSIAGVMHIMKHACSVCVADGKNTWTNYDYEGWTSRDWSQLKLHAQEWRDAGTLGERTEIETQHNIRWSVLNELPYWNPIEQLSVDGMHLIENLCKHHSQLLHMTEKEPSVPIGYAFNSPGDRPWASASAYLRDTDISKSKFVSLVHPPTTPDKVDKLIKEIDKLQRLLMTGVPVPSGEELKAGAAFEETKKLYEPLNKLSLPALHWICLDLNLSPMYGSTKQWWDAKAQELPDPPPKKKPDPPAKKEPWIAAILLWRRNQPWACKHPGWPTGTPELINTFNDVVETIEMPSHYERPVRYLEAGGRHARARDQRTVYEMLLPFAVISIWGLGSSIALGGGPKAAFYSDALNTTMALVCAVTLIGKRAQSAQRANSYREHLRTWRRGVDEQFRDYLPKPTWHFAFHLYESIWLFGPANSFWVFAYERLIGQLQRFRKNHHVSQTEETVIKSFQRGMHMRFWLNHPRCPPVLKTCKSIIDRVFHGRNSTMRGHDIDMDDTRADADPLLLPIAESELARLVGDTYAMTKARLRSSVNEAYYCQAGTHAGNSLIIYYPQGVVNDKEPVYASIHHIFKLPGDARWKFAVKRQQELRGIDDPYARWPDFKGKLFSSNLDPGLQLVEEGWIVARYARWKLLRDKTLTATLALYQD